MLTAGVSSREIRFFNESTGTKNMSTGRQFKFLVTPPKSSFSKHVKHEARACLSGNFPNNLNVLESREFRKVVLVALYRGYILDYFNTINTILSIRLKMCIAMSGPVL